MLSVTSSLFVVMVIVMVIVMVMQRVRQGASIVRTPFSALTSVMLR
jgi:hypothetical protein